MNCAITIIDPYNRWASFLVSVHLFLFLNLLIWPPNHLALLLVRCLLFTKGFQRGECYGFYFMSQPILLKFLKGNCFFDFLLFLILHISFRFNYIQIKCVFSSLFFLSLFLPLFYSTVAQNLSLSPSRPIRIKWVLTASPFLTSLFFTLTLIWHNLSLVACSALCHSRPALPK